MRGDQVEAVFDRKDRNDLNLIRVNAKDRFYEKLKGVTEPWRRSARSSVRNSSASSRK